MAARRALEWIKSSKARLVLDMKYQTCLGHMFLVLVDAHPKWVEVFLMSSATSKANY